MKRGLLVLALVCASGCTDYTLSKQDSAMVGALAGAGVGALLHKTFKAKPKDAAIYGAVAGGILGHVAGDDTESTHTITANTCYDKKLPDGRTVQVCEKWYQKDHQKIK